MRSYMLAGGLIFMGALAFFIFRGLKESRRKNKIISEQKQEVEEQKFIIEEKNKEIIDSIHYAKNLQNAILPSKKTLDEAFENYFLFYQPKDIVAGDFYFLEKVKNDQQQSCIIAAAADSTGHGVPGAMVSVVCANALNRCVNEFGLTIPGEILDHTAQLIENTFGKSEREVRDGMDISLICYLPDSKKLYWSGANNPLWLIRNGALMEIKPDKQPVGKFELRQAFNTHELQLQSGDEIIMVTDGFADQFGGPGGKKFKNKQLQKLLLELNALSGIEKEQNLQQAFVAWKGSLEQVDDVTLFGFKV
jgi:serine phosphatase RsbU (regulator of sigma subunit)